MVYNWISTVCITSSTVNSQPRYLDSVFPWWSSVLCNCTSRGFQFMSGFFHAFFGLMTLILNNCSDHSFFELTWFLCICRFMLKMQLDVAWLLVQLVLWQSYQVRIGLLVISQLWNYAFSPHATWNSLFVKNDSNFCWHLTKITSTIAPLTENNNLSFLGMVW